MGTGRVTNHFGDLVETIYDNFEKNAANVVDNIYNELVEESPVQTGTLASNWKKGIRPNTKADNIRPKNTSRQKYQKPQPSSQKTYGRHERYYIWNNTPYLVYVNAGINPLFPDSAKVAASKGFVRRAIKRGEAKAAGKI